MFGLCLGWWLMVKGWGIYGRILWGVGTLALVSGFAVTAYKGARGLSGAAPKRFTWIPVNLPGNIAAYERAQVEEFLRQNSGHLAQPVTIYSLEDKGLFGNSEPSLDGNALAEDIDSGSKLHALLASSDALSSHNQVSSIRLSGNLPHLLP